MKRIINLICFLCFLFFQTLAVVAQEIIIDSDAYEKNSYGRYQIENQYISLPYFVPHAYTTWEGPLTSTFMHVTNNKIETDENKTWYSSNGINANVYYPIPKEGTDVSNNPLPVIVYGYGGGFIRKLNTNDFLVPQWLAKSGFIVVVPQYRVGVDFHDTELAKRAIWRGLQDMRVVNKYARTMSSDDFYADQEAPLTYVGWSAGAIIGLHNLYLANNLESIPTSITGEYEAKVRGKYEREVLGTLIVEETLTPYDLGSADEPTLMGPNTDYDWYDSIKDNNPEPEINVCIAGAIGNIDWIKQRVSAPKSLYLMHHRKDSVVPSTYGKVFKGFGLFDYSGWKYPEVYGSIDIDYEIQYGIGSEMPNYYRIREITEDCSGGEDASNRCITGNAGGETGPAGYKSWWHNPTENAENTDVMNSILDFITISTKGMESDSTTCLSCEGIKLATPVLVNYSEDETEIEQTIVEESSFTNDPSNFDNSLANCLISYPYTIYTATEETHLLIPADISDNIAVEWYTEEDANCIYYRYVDDEITYSNAEAGRIIVGIPSDDEDLPSDMGWEPLYDESGVQLEYPPTTFGVSYKLFQLDIQVDNEFIQAIPAGTLVWGASKTHGIYTIDEYSDYSDSYLSSLKSSELTSIETKDISSTESYEMEVFPNPSENWIKIQLPNQSTASIQIYNLQGALIQELEYDDSHHSEGININLENYQKGIYIIRAIQDGSNYIQKIIKK